MKNFLCKFVFILGVLITGTQTILGYTNASEYYIRYTHEFLGYLGQNNPTSVPVRKITPDDKYYAGAAGYANGMAIYINEDLLNKQRQSEAVRLFTCAHEATHHALGHSRQVRRNVLEIEQEADVEAARMLCKNGYRWIVEQEVAHLGRLVQAGRGNYTDGQHATTQQQYVYLNQVLQANSANVGSAKAVKAAPVNKGQQRPAQPVRQPQPVKPAQPVKANAGANAVKVNQAARKAAGQKLARKPIKKAPARVANVGRSNNKVGQARRQVKAAPRKKAAAVVVKSRMVRKVALNRARR